MIKFRLYGFSSYYSKTLREVEQVYNDTSADVNFHQLIITNSPYTYSKEPADEIIRDICEKDLEIKIKGYRQNWFSWHFRAKVRAYTYHGSDTIYLNTRFSRRTKEKLHGTIRHEVAHVLGYSHGKNRSHGYSYENSVPVKLGFLSRHFKQA